MEGYAGKQFVGGGYPFHCPWGATPLPLVVNGRRRHNGWGSGTASWCLGAVKWIPPFVGIDLHRRRTVIVRTTEGGEVLESVRIVNDVERLASVMARAGECPEVVLEATYGWYWAVDALQAGGASVHLAHPLGVKAFEYRRVKNDVRDAQDLADLLRMGRLPEA